MTSPLFLARISNAAIAFLLVGAALAILGGLYAWQAWRDRGKPPVRRRGTLHLGDSLLDGWLGGPLTLGDPTPGVSALPGRRDVNAPTELEPDPRRR
ncbi:MAG: hypothetical protein ACOX83_08230 [Candidatus Spyradocola sp.]